MLNCIGVRLDVYWMLKMKLLSCRNYRLVRSCLLKIVWTRLDVELLWNGCGMDVEN